MSSEVLKDYKRFDDVEICSNQFINVKYIITFDKIPPLLIGKGEKPLIWLSMKSSVSFSWFYIVANNVSLINEIKIDISKLLEKGEEIRLKARDIMKRTQQEMTRMKKSQEYDLPLYV